MKTDKVLCLIKEEWFEPDLDCQEAWMDLVPTYQYPRRVEYVLPLYDHPHNDSENGQTEVHYHQNTRYMVKNVHIPGKFSSFKHGRIILPLIDGEYLEYRQLKQVREEELAITPLYLIMNSSPKHNCIHRGKCPHRGYDLSKEIPIYDENYGGEVIVCPLHGLKFDAETGDMLTNLQQVRELNDLFKPINPT